MAKHDKERSNHGKKPMGSLPFTFAVIILAGINFWSAHEAVAFYNPAAGRWLNRDPLEERGAAMLYSFTANDPIKRMDMLGRSSLSGCDLRGNPWLVSRLFGLFVFGVRAQECLNQVKFAHSQLGHIVNDKLAHCFLSCKLSNPCGRIIADFLGIVKETRDLSAGGIELALQWLPENARNWLHDNLQGGTIKDSAEDFEANFTGLGCADDNRNCRQCCECKYGKEP